MCSDDVSKASPKMNVVILIYMSLRKARASELLTIEMRFVRNLIFFEMTTTFIFGEAFGTSSEHVIFVINTLNQNFQHQIT